jgi:hypothetical protein
MSTFLSEAYKPKLIEPKIIKKMINNENNQVKFETKVREKITDFCFKNYKVIIFCLIILGSLYWRYNEIQRKRNIENNNIYEEDSDDVSSEEN